MVSIVGMMIVPLPTPLLDLLISVNIAAAVTLLLVAIYVSDALKMLRRGLVDGNGHRLGEAHRAA